MKKLVLMFFLILPQSVFALDLVNNTRYPVSITVNGNSGVLKPHAIVDYRAPKMKAPFHITAVGKRNSGKAFSCKKTVYDFYAFVTIPEDCR